MPLIPDSDDLRTLNLAYRHLQRVFRVLMPDWFRTNSSLTTDASGYLYLPTTVMEVEDIRDSNNNKVDLMDIQQKYFSSGYYHDGVDTGGSTNDGKRRLMVREGGAAKVSAVYTVHYTREFADLATVSSVPYPFSQKAYLDMLTTLQAYYWLQEQGNERKGEKEDRWSEFQRHFELAGFDAQDDEPEYLSSSHSDAGDRRSHPILNVSTS